MYMLPTTAPSKCLPLSNIDSKIHINLHGCIDMSINVLPTDSIFSIQNFTTLDNCQYSWKNLVLCPAMSFAFYNITDGDQIFVHPIQTEHPLQISPMQSSSKPIISQVKKRFDLKFAQKFKEPDEFFLQHIQPSFDPETKLESARLADISRIKIESNPSSYRRICSRFSSVKSLDDHHFQKIPTVIPRKAISPSTDTLPMFSLHLPSADGVHSLPSRSFTPIPH